jgi:zinc protease
MILIVLFVLVFPVGAAVEYSPEFFTALADSVNEIPYVETPAYKRIKLDNGMVVYLAVDHELPLVEVVGYIKGGISQESPELAGISLIMTRLMNTGTKNYSEAELSRYKELNGVNFNLSSSYDRYNFSANSLSMDQEALIALIAEILRNPEFEATYHNRILQEYYQVLLQQYYYDFSLLEMFFNTILYGDHPYAHTDNIGLVISALERMTPAQLGIYYQQTIDPAKLVMAISGDFNLQEMEAIVVDNFGDWESKGLELKEEKVVIDEANFQRIVLINKADATHAKMKIGYNFYDSSFEDEIPFLMANQIFGGGDFSSRLMDHLRSERGYVYGIYSGVTYNQQGGLYYISTDVAPDKACEILEAVTAEILSIKEGDEKISAEELFKNVNCYNAFFPKSYRNQISVLAKLMFDQEIMGKEKDSINNFIKAYNDLTPAEVQEVFAKHTFPERFFTLIVGKKEEILPAFLEQGLAVEVIELF